MKNLFKGMNVSIQFGKKAHGTEAVVENLKVVKEVEAKVIDAKVVEPPKAPKYSTILKAIDNAMEGMEDLTEIYGAIIAAAGEDNTKESEYYKAELAKCVKRRTELQDVRDTIVLKQSFEKISEQLGENSGKELLEQLAKKIMDANK